MNQWGFGRLGRYRRLEAVPRAYLKHADALRHEFGGAAFGASEFVFSTQIPDRPSYLPGRPASNVGLIFPW